MKDIPKPLLVVFAVVILLFVAIVVFANRSADEARDDPEAAQEESGWVDGIGAESRLTRRDVVGFSNCSTSGIRNIFIDGSCKIAVPPAEGLLRRVTFRSFDLAAVGDEEVDFRISSPDIDKLDLDSDEEIEGTITNDAEDDDERDEITVGIPPGGILVELDCPGIGPGNTCVVEVR